MGRKIDLIGQKFGRLTVLKFSHRDKYSKTFWLCKCDCGNTITIIKYSLISNNTRSCGCLQKEIVIKNSTKHKLCKTSEYSSWMNMKQRCLNPRNTSYRDYGDRGITICKRWLDSFENFLEDMGEKPSKYYSIERIDNELGYFKDNCKWANKKEQCNNQRSNSKVINTKTKQIFNTISEAAKFINMNYNTLYCQLNGSRKNKTNLKLYEN